MTKTHPLRSFEEAPRLLYFAYGSNLCVDNMRRRCRDAKPVEPLIITRGALVFRSVADVEQRSKPKYKIPGGLWSISHDDREQLDRYEGISSGTYRRCYLRVDIDGEEKIVLYYKMNETGIAPPASAYLEIIVRGYRDFGLDEYLPVLNRAVERSWERKRITPYLRQRRERDGRPELATAVEG
jgi:hypothetical protein